MKTTIATLTIVGGLVAPLSFAEADTAEDQFWMCVLQRAGSVAGKLSNDEAYQRFHECLRAYDVGNKDRCRRAALREAATEFQLKNLHHLCEIETNRDPKIQEGVDGLEMLKEQHK